MFYHPHDTKIAAFTKHLAFWIGLCSMFALFIFLTISEEIEAPQKEVTLEIDIKNRVNICLPEDEENFEETIFGF